MNRIITILVTIFILLLLYIWISHVWGSNKPRNQRHIVDARENHLSGDLFADADTAAQPLSTSTTVTEETVVATPAVTEDPKEEVPAETTIEPPVQQETKNEGPTIAKGTSTTPEKPVEKKPAEKKSDPEPAKKPATQESKPAATPSKPATGKHLVIAGNFTQLANAQRQLQDLKKAGFTDAEIVNFDLSEYHTVCAGRFADVNEARRLVKKLKDYHKIDAYVRIGG